MNEKKKNEDGSNLGGMRVNMLYKGTANEVLSSDDIKTIAGQIHSIRYFCNELSKEQPISILLTGDNDSVAIDLDDEDLKHVSRFLECLVFAKVMGWDE